MRHTISSNIQGGLRHGGLTAALAPYRPVITEDVSKSRPKMRQSAGTGKGYTKNESYLKEEEENAGIRLNEPATKFSIPHTMTNSSGSSCSTATTQQ